MKRIIVACFFGFLLLAGGIFTSPPSQAAIDSGAKTEFKQSIEEVGGPSENNLASKIKGVINLLLFLGGTIAVIVIVIAGIRFTTADGDPSKADKARNTVVYAVIGLVVAVTAYALVNFVLENI